MKSYLKFLSRNKLYTAIEAVGLVVSIAFVILIGNYVWQQYRISYENPISERVYGVGSSSFVALSWWDKAEFDSKLPEAETVCRISNTEEGAIVSIGDNKLTNSMTLVDKEFFEVFPNYQLIEGSLDEFALKGYCLVSESFAKQIANIVGTDVIGTHLRAETYFSGQELTVCGIYKDFRNTLMPDVGILANAEFDPFYSTGELRAFSTIGQYISLIKVSEGTDRETLADHIHDICIANYGKTWIQDFPIYSLPELFFSNQQYFFKRGNKSLLQMLTVVVLLLLISAIFNYVNLNLALSGRRAKEMATRRLLGASQRGIMLKYIIESIAFTAVCFALALLLAWFLLPMMNKLLMDVSDVGNTWAYVQINLNLTTGTFAFYVFSIIMIGTIVGIAPALIASRYEPIDVVRGTFCRRSKMVFSKIFIIFQNAISVLLIAMAILMSVQLTHMMNRPLNARSEGLFRLTFTARDYSEIKPLVDRLTQIPQVKRVAYGAGFPGQMSMGFGFSTPEDKTANTQLIICTPEYFDMLGLKINKDYGTPREGSVWMSKHLADEIQLSDSTLSYYAPRFRINGAATEYVGGVYEDIPTADASSENPAENSAVVVSTADKILYGNGVMIEVDGDEKEAADAILKAYSDFCIEKDGTKVEPSQAGYIVDVLNEQLVPEKMTLRLIELFMILAVLISLLGLLAMSAYYSVENTKIIAIRKVFGSDITHEIWRTIKGYMVLVGIAVIIGIAVATWIAEKYLSQFAYRIENYSWVFVVAAFISITIAFASVLWQTLKAARTNPAIELKKE
ncbi:MAG: FtsX-like permease family protein [Bacteroidaceae bacterium]|nr:FtsX-like permease family protein [Bacteroidaceae bacterium]MBQ9883800.1 FtsX-like permease family protein [Bacteroidaceae bacterium]